MLHHRTRALSAGVWLSQPSCTSLWQIHFDCQGEARAPIITRFSAGELRFSRILFSANKGGQRTAAKPMCCACLAKSADLRRLRQLCDSNSHPSPNPPVSTCAALAEAESVTSYAVTPYSSLSKLSCLRPASYKHKIVRKFPLTAVRKPLMNPLLGTV